MKYYQDSITTTNYISYTLLNSKGDVIREYKNTACFAAITFYGIPNNTETILIHHKKNQIPYKDEEIARWIRDLNEMDFPCAFIPPMPGDTQRYFEVKTGSYQFKSHLISTLTLIRTLYEIGICYVPDAYFQMMDEHPTDNKLDVLQRAHKKPLGKYGNTNHMITFPGNGKKSITKEKLYSRYHSCGVKVMYGKENEYCHLDQSNKWIE